MAKLYFNYGAMNAGKSTILLQAAYNYKERGMRTLLMKPVIDTRGESAQEISSRIGLRADADIVTTSTDLFEYIMTAHDKKPLDCVFVDEAQFLSAGQVWQLAAAVDHIEIPVMCYGLRTDFRGLLFPGSAALLALSDIIKEIKTMCWCGRKAIMTIRLDSEGQAVLEGTQIEIGGNDRYVSLCRKHWSGRQLSDDDTA